MSWLTRTMGSLSLSLWSRSRQLSFTVNIDSSRRLIQQEQLCLGSQSSGDENPLSLAARQLAKSTTRKIFGTGLRQSSAGCLVM